MIYPNQTRYIDPFSDISSEYVNERLQAIFPTGMGCLYGLLVQIQSGSIVVTTGIALQNWVVINIQQEVTFSIPADGYYYIVLRYSYVLQQPPNQAEIGIVTTAQYVASTDVIIADITVSGGIVTIIDYSLRNGNPLESLVSQALQTTGLQGTLNANGFGIINLATPVNPQDGATKNYVDSNVGLVKVSSTDTANYLSTKFENSTTVTYDVNTTTNQIIFNSTDQFVAVNSADSGRRFI